MLISAFLYSTVFQGRKRLYGAIEGCTWVSKESNVQATRHAFSSPFAVFQLYLLCVWKEVQEGWFPGFTQSRSSLTLTFWQIWISIIWMLYPDEHSSTRPWLKNLEEFLLHLVVGSSQWDSNATAVSKTQVKRYLTLPASCIDFGKFERRLHFITIRVEIPVSSPGVSTHYLHWFSHSFSSPFTETLLIIPLLDQRRAKHFNSKPFPWRWRCIYFHWGQILTALYFQWRTQRMKPSIHSTCPVPGSPILSTVLTPFCQENLDRPAFSSYLSVYFGSCLWSWICV